MLSDQELQSLRNFDQRAADEIFALRFELQECKKINLAVVRRLQAEIDKLKREAEKDAEYLSWLRTSADEAEQRANNSYNCGEL